MLTMKKRTDPSDLIHKYTAKMTRKQLQVYLFLIVNRDQRENGVGRDTQPRWWPEQVRFAQPMRNHRNLPIAQWKLLLQQIIRDYFATVDKTGRLSLLKIARFLRLQRTKKQQHLPAVQHQQPAEQRYCNCLVRLDQRIKDIIDEHKQNAWTVVKQRVLNYSANTTNSGGTKLNEVDAPETKIHEATRLTPTQSQPLLIRNAITVTAIDDQIQIPSVPKLNRTEPDTPESVPALKLPKPIYIPEQKPLNTANIQNYIKNTTNTNTKLTEVNPKLHEHNPTVAQLLPNASRITDQISSAPKLNRLESKTPEVIYIDLDEIPDQIPDLISRKTRIRVDENIFHYLLKQPKVILDDVTSVYENYQKAAFLRNFDLVKVDKTHQVRKERIERAFRYSKAKANCLIQASERTKIRIVRRKPKNPPVTQVKPQINANKQHQIRDCYVKLYRLNYTYHNPTFGAENNDQTRNNPVKTPTKAEIQSELKPITVISASNLNKTLKNLFPHLDQDSKAENQPESIVIDLTLDPPEKSTIKSNNTQLNRRKPANSRQKPKQNSKITKNRTSKPKTPPTSLYSSPTVSKTSHSPFNRRKTLRKVREKSKSPSKPRNIKNINEQTSKSFETKNDLNKTQQNLINMGFIQIFK